MDLEYNDNMIEMIHLANLTNASESHKLYKNTLADINSTLSTEHSVQTKPQTIWSSQCLYDFKVVMIIKNITRFLW